MVPPPGVHDGRPGLPPDEREKNVSAMLAHEEPSSTPSSIQPMRIEQTALAALTDVPHDARAQHDQADRGCDGSTPCAMRRYRFTGANHES